MGASPVGHRSWRTKALALDRDHVTTYFTEGLLLICILLVYRLAAQQGSEALDSYVVVRRTISFLQPIATIGLAVGLPRMVALSSDLARQRRYLRSATVMSGSAAMLVVVFAFLFPSFLAQFVFGSAEYAVLVLPMAIMVLGLCLHSMAYSYLRGRHRMVLANVLQGASLALAPVVAFLLTDQLDQVLWITGSVWCLSPMPVLVPELFGATGSAQEGERAELLRYGLPRIPGDFALAGILTIPIYWVGHIHGLEAAGRLGLGITLLNIVGAAFAPISLLALPKTAAQLAARDHAGLLKSIGLLTKWTLLGVAAMTVLIELLMDVFLKVYLGPAAGEGYALIGRVFFLAAPAFAYFIGLRSVLDAFHTTPRNGINLMVTFWAMLILCGASALIGAGPVGMALAVVASLYLLAFRTWRDVRFMKSELMRLSVASPADFRILLVLPGQPDGNEMPFSRRQARALHQVHGADVKIFFLTNRFSPTKLWQARRALQALIRKHRPDVVHVHYGTMTALFTVLSSAVPVVITFHGSDLNPTPSDGRLRDLIGRIFSQLAAFFAAGLICVSEPLRNRLWWRRDEVRILPMGVDLTTFRPMDRETARRELGWNEDTKVVLFNGNNPALKRLDIAQATVDRTHAAGIPVRLEVLVGAIDPQRMPLLMNAADALLLCSDREGSPTMVKEAMACGLPVVTSDVGDVRERLKDVHPGAVVAQDVAQLADALNAVLSDGGRSNGRELAARNGVDAGPLDAATYAFLRSVVKR